MTGASVLNIRSGPGTNFPVIGAARQGDSGTIVGRSQDGRWWVVDAPSLPGGVGWVSADFVTATNAENVPVIAVAAAPDAHADPRAAHARRPCRRPRRRVTDVHADGSARRTDQLLGRPDADQPGRVRDAQSGTCSNVQAVWVYPQGADFNAFPRTGQGNERVCPAVTTTYEMRVLLNDGSTQFRQVTINVVQPIASPQPPAIRRSRSIRWPGRAGPW